jgi:hypothetical protein
MEAAARTAAHIGDEPGDRRMTRHGMVEPTAAGAPPLATNPRAATAIADADMGLPGPVPGFQYRAEAQRSGPSASTIALPSAGCANADIGRGSKSP